MKLYFSDNPFPQTVTKSIFLAGPSPRSKDVYDWRHDAINYLKKINFNGEVLIPIPEKVFLNQSDETEFNYINQIDWECKARSISDYIVFWIPRNIKNGMPGFTTNVEFGEDLFSNKIIYGRPDNAEKCKYLDLRYKETKQFLFKSLETMLDYVTSKLGDGSLREHGETFIPLFIWNSQQFKSWYSNLIKSGNKLINAKVLHSSNFNNGSLFSFILHVNVWLSEEKRYKTNEFIFSRIDISSVFAYFKNEIDTYVILIKEFRSAVSNEFGYVFELPSGSSFENVTPKINAQHELFEETGLFVKDINRFNYVSHKQIYSTLNTHKNTLYKLELNKDEFDFLTEQQNKTNNYENDLEVTHIVITKLSEINKLPLDYSTLGMIYSSTFGDK